jgi:hypothetical protein
MHAACHWEEHQAAQAPGDFGPGQRDSATSGIEISPSGQQQSCEIPL